MSQELRTMTVGEIRARARNEAQAVLDRYWQSGRVPVDPVHLARSLGASVFSAQLGDDTWGMLVGSAGGADIYLDRDQPEVRFRFSCAHELGHLIDRGEALDQGQAFVDRRTDADRGNADEVFANEFAASLLMPPREFKYAAASGLTNFDLATQFNVSLDAVRWRRRHLSV